MKNKSSRSIFYDEHPTDFGQNEVFSFQEKVFYSMLKLNSKLVDEIENMKCECVHQSRISEYKSYDRKWKAMYMTLLIILVVMIWFSYAIGIAFGAYYCHLFGSGGGYINTFWSTEHPVAY